MICKEIGLFYNSQIQQDSFQPYFQIVLSSDEEEAGFFLLKSTEVLTFVAEKSMYEPSVATKNIPVLVKQHTMRKLKISSGNMDLGGL